MDYFAVMNAESCLGGGSYQHEIIVGDEDPSLSFASSPSWVQTFEEIEEIDVKDELMDTEFNDDVVYKGIQGDDHTDDGDCDSPEPATTDPVVRVGPDEDSQYENYQDLFDYKRNKSLDDGGATPNVRNDYTKLLDGCKIIKRECSGYSTKIPLGDENELAESSQSDDEQHSSDAGDIDTMTCESRSTTRHDSGGSAVNSDEENEARFFHKQKVAITLQPKIFTKERNQFLEKPFENEDELEGGKIRKGTRKNNGYAKPRLSYAQLIAEALMGAEHRRLTLNDIYVKINARHPYYSLGGDRGNAMSPPNWQNAVRHNLTLNKAFIKVPRPANEGRGSFWSLASGSEKDIFKRLLRQHTIPNATSTSSSKHIYNRISSSPAPISLAVPTSKPKQLTSVATQTYPSSVHFDVSQSPLLSSSVHTPPPSPPLPPSKQYVTYQPSSRFSKVQTPNIKVVRSISSLKADASNGTNQITPIAPNKGTTSSKSSTKPTIIYVTLPKRASKT